MDTVKITAFAGSVRKDSVNRKLLSLALSIAGELGCQTDLIDLRDYPMPLYDGDYERSEGQPSQAKALKARILLGDALLLACPEYNASITPLLKNTIDWLSRPQPGEAGVFKTRPTALLAASAGALGGLRGLTCVRATLTQLGALVVPTQFALGSAGAAFDEAGQLANAAQRAMISDVLAELNMVAGALRLHADLAHKSVAAR